MNHVDEYITKDLGETAFLITKGCQFQGILWKDGIGYFRFSDPAAASIGKDYFYSTVTVHPRTFYDNLRMIKRQLYASETDAQGRRRRQ